MTVATLSRKELKRLLHAIGKANRKRKPGEALLEFSLIVKEPKEGKNLVRIITGTVPASFRYSPRTPIHSRKSG